jgi:hypothetical protein
MIRKYKFNNNGLVNIFIMIPKNSITEKNNR